MSVAKSLRSHAWWLLLVPAAAGLVLLAARTLAEQRAQEAAMSAELLTPFAEGGTLSVADGPEPGSANEGGDTDGADVSGTATPPPDPAAADGVPSIVPPDLMGALISDSVAAPSPVEPPPLDPSLFADWSSYEDAVARSRATGRPVMLAFTALGCETCESLREAVFDDEAGSVTLRSAVIPVAVHDVFAESGDEVRLVDDLQRRFGVTTFPTLVVWSPVTKRLRTLKGFRGAAATLRFITDSASAVD